jgi:hypothetical protein
MKYPRRRSRKSPLKTPSINVTSVVASVYCERKVVLDQLYGAEHTLENQHAQQAGENAHCAFERNSQQLMKEQDEARVEMRDRRCYVASYALGVDHPTTHTLRLWRDEVLMRTLMGRRFVRVYYRISPFLIRVAQHVPYFKLLSAFVIERFAKFLLQASANKNGEA